MIRFIELFAGIGGFRAGLENTNRSSLSKQMNGTKKRRSSLYIKSDANGKQKSYTCVWANEIDKYACQIYRKHYGEGELYEGDITKVDAGTIPDHDLLCAGFPCPSFSIAGKRKGFQDKRGQLFFEIIRIAKAKEPMYLLLENVKGLISHDKGKTLKKYLNTCKAWGIILIGKYTTRKSMVFRKTGKGYFLYADI